MNFLYSFVTYLQPGILWPQLADLRPTIASSALGLACALFYKPAYPRRAAFMSPIIICLTIFLCAQVLSVYYSGVMQMVEEFGVWSVQFAFVVVSLLLISNARALQRFVWGMIVGATFVVLYGIWAFYEQIGFAVTGRAGAYGMYENHNDYSFIIVQIVPFLYMYFRAEVGIFRRVFLLGALLACVIGMLLSLSRGGILSFVLECVLIVLIGMKGRARLLWLPVLALVGAGAIVHQWAMRAENQGEGYTAMQAERSRFELWRAARKMIVDRPLLGVGSRRFAEYAKVYEDLSHDQLGKVAHNTYLEVLATSGFLGFIPFMLMLYLLVRELRRCASATGPPMLHATRIATLISLYAIMFRALLGSKTQDWSFYTLCVIGVTCCLLLRQTAPAYEPVMGAAKPLPA